MGCHQHPGVTCPPPPQACRIFPNRSLSTLTHNHVFLYASGLSPYCCYMCPGLHRTAVISVRAFTVLLFYSYLNNTRTGLPMELSNYPPNTIIQALPECRYYPNWAATNTPGSPVRPHHRPAGYSRTALSAH